MRNMNDFVFVKMNRAMRCDSEVALVVGEVGSGGIPGLKNGMEEAYHTAPR